MFFADKQLDEIGLEVKAMSPNDILEATMDFMDNELATTGTHSPEYILNQIFWREFRKLPGFCKNHYWIHPEAKMSKHWLNFYKTELLSGLKDEL